MIQKDEQLLNIYYVIQIILFLIIKVMEQLLKVPEQGDPGLPGSPLAMMRYSVIVCNFLLIVYLHSKYGQRFNLCDNLIPLAFAFTLMADTCMCVMKDARPMGYLLFTLVETIYMIYMKPTWKSIAARLTLYAVMLFVLKRVGRLDLSNALAMANIVQFTVNLFCAWIQKFRVKSRETLFFALGITLFVGCDYSILVRTLAEKLLSVSHPVYLVAAFLVWTCYIPSQVLLLRSYVEKIRMKDS
ncbi:MAG: lysoplasmalogenase family protein [Eubacterium sp.]|nr:lysoplasmalogenase family protein [Eubacterium sp.]